MSEKLPKLTSHQRRLLRWIERTHLPYVWYGWSDKKYRSVLLTATTRFAPPFPTNKEKIRRPRRATFDDLLEKKLVVIMEHPLQGYDHFRLVMVSTLGVEVLRA